jgi:predicted enzyme related to lactoylglutathione lyase
LDETTHLFAGLAVSDYQSACGWYERLFGRPPDVLPQEDEALWQLTSTTSVYVVRDRGRAGQALLTLAVENLDEHLAEIAERVPSEPIEPPQGTPRRAVIRDPDGNTITFFEDPGSKT